MTTAASPTGAVRRYSRVPFEDSSASSFIESRGGRISSSAQNRGEAPKTYSRVAVMSTQRARVRAAWNIELIMKPFVSSPKNSSDQASGPAKREPSSRR